MKMNRLALVLFVALSAPLVQAAETAPHVYTGVAMQPESVRGKEIAGLFDQWNKALKTGNPDTVVNLYAANAVLQPTVSNQVRSSPEEIKNYFEKFLTLKPQGLINYRQIRELGSNVAMDSGVYTFTLTEADGKKRDVQARYTFVYEKVGGEWKILNHHSSAMPEVQAMHTSSSVTQ